MSSGKTARAHLFRLYRFHFRIHLLRGAVLHDLRDIPESDSQGDDRADHGGDMVFHVQAFRCVEDVHRDDACHEHGRHAADPVHFVVLEQIHRRGPQHEGRDDLVGPADVSPQERVVDRRHVESRDGERDGDQ